MAMILASVSVIKSTQWKNLAKIDIFTNKTGIEWSQTGLFLEKLLSYTLGFGDFSEIILTIKNY